MARSLESDQQLTRQKAKQQQSEGAEVWGAWAAWGRCHVGWEETLHPEGGGETRKAVSRGNEDPSVCRGDPKGQGPVRRSEQRLGEKPYQGSSRKAARVVRSSALGLGPSF